MAVVAGPTVNPSSRTEFAHSIYNFCQITLFPPALPAWCGVLRPAGSCQIVSCHHCQGTQSRPRHFSNDQGLLRNVRRISFYLQVQFYVLIWYSTLRILIWTFCQDPAFLLPYHHIAPCRDRKWNKESQIFIFYYSWYCAARYIMVSGRLGLAEKLTY